MRSSRLAAIGLSLALLGGGLAAPARAATPASGPASGSVSAPAAVTAVLAADRYPCRGYGHFNYYNPVEAVQRDIFKWEYPAVKVGDGRHNINWKPTPTRSRAGAPGCTRCTGPAR